MTSSPHTQSVTANGVGISYDRYGSPDAPPIVLLHGIGAGRGSWATIAPALATTHSVFALDMRGHGESDWPGVYSHELMRDDVLGFLDVMDLHDTTLIGHSMGGTIAMLVAMTHPERVARLIIEDTPLPRRDMPPIPLRARPKGLLRFDWQVIETIVAEVNAADPSWWDDLPNIQVPTLFIAGGPHSTMSQDLVAETATTVTGAQLVTIPAGHHVHATEPAAFLAAVTAFV